MVIKPGAPEAEQRSVAQGIFLVAEGRATVQAPEGYGITNNE
jgi:hypothetical protein